MVAPMGFAVVLSSDDKLNEKKGRALRTVKPHDTIGNVSRALRLPPGITDR